MVQTEKKLKASLNSFSLVGLPPFDFCGSLLNFLTIWSKIPQFSQTWPEEEGKGGNNGVDFTG